MSQAPRSALFIVPTRIALYIIYFDQQLLKATKVHLVLMSGWNAAGLSSAVKRGNDQPMIWNRKIMTLTL
jgi:hypothetical protein